MYYTDVILPIPLRQTFTYSVNEDEAKVIQTGMRVAVPFGKSKIYTGIVARVYEGEQPEYEVKAIDQVLDDVPIVNLQQLKHWLWMANYYMCTLGEVIRTVVTHPDTVLQIVATERKGSFLWQLLVPLVGLPLLGFPAILLALPTLAYSLLSDYEFQTSIRYHYTAPLIPFLFLATVVALRGLRAARVRGRRRR